MCVQSSCHFVLDFILNLSSYDHFVKRDYMCVCVQSMCHFVLDFVLNSVELYVCSDFI